MKKQILKIGNALNRAELKEITGGIGGKPGCGHNLCVDECGTGHPGNAGCSGNRTCMRFPCQPTAGCPTYYAYYCVNQNPFGGGEQ